MKKIKTSEATGAALDWLVAKCESVFDQYPGMADAKAFWAVHLMAGELTYSTDWAQGGSIIEREEISIDRFGSYPLWEGLAPTQVRPVAGRTPLIAAMRCYVADKLGDEVEVPEELL